LATEPKLERFIGYILQAASQQFDAPLAEYWRHSKSVAYIKKAAVQGKIVTTEQLVGHPGLDGFSVPSALVNEEQLQGRLTHFVIDDLGTDPLIAEIYPRFVRWCESLGVQPHREVNIPVTLGGQSFGSLVIYLSQSQQFSDEQIELGYALAHQMSLAIQLTQLAEDNQQVAVLEERDRISQQRAIELAQVNNVLKDSLNRLASEHDLDVFLGYVIDTINQQVGAAAGYIFLHEPETDTLAIRLSVRFGEITIGPADHDAAIFQTPTPVDVTPVYSLICQSREIILSSMENEHDLMYWPGTLEWHHQMGHQESGMLALRSGDQPIGFLGLSFMDKTSLTAGDKELIFALADQASLAIQLAKLAEGTKQTAVIQEREQFAQTRAAELEAHNQVLEGRDRILEATAAVSNVLLTDQDFDLAFNQAMKIIGEAVGTDRVGIAENLTDLTEVVPGHWRVIYEWAAPGIPPVAQIHHPEPMQGTYAGAEPLYALHQKGDGFSLSTDQMTEPFRSSMAFVGVQTLHSVPIILRGKYWGTIVFGDCCQPRLRSNAELAALKTVADCIGNAIDRDRTRKEREAATQFRATELETFNQQLQQRDSLLNSVNAAAQCLVATEDLSVALPNLLQILGKGTRQCRAYILQNSRDEQTDELWFNLTLEWNAPGIPTKLEAGGRFPVPVNTFPNNLTAPLKSGRATQFLARKLDGLDKRDRGQALSLVGVPITVEGEWWGLLGLDDCIEERVWSESEIAVLETAATSIGSALERDLTHKAREAAERETLITRERAARAAELEVANQILSTRERWLDATAAAANELLSTADVDASVNAALKTIGMNLGCDRIGVMRHVPAPPGLGLFQVLYEWDSPNTRPQITDSETKQMPVSAFEEWSKQLMAGHWVGGIVAELDEPFRSTMQDLNTLSTYAMPMFFETEFWGLMFMDHCQEVKQLTPAELAVFNTVVTCIGSAIYRDQMRSEREQATRDILLQQEREQAAQQRAAELAKANEAIGQTLNALTAKPELDEFLGQLLSEMAQQIGACKAHLFLYEEETRTLTQHIAVQEQQIYIGVAPTDPEMFHHPFSVDISGAWEAIINSPKPFTLDESNPDNAKLYWPDSLPWHTAEGHRSSTCACMKVGQQPIGFIGFAFRYIANLTDEQLEFIQALTNQATLAIQLTRLADQSQTAALLDERNRLAREIHDTLAQAFTGVSLQLEAAKGILHQQPEKAQTYINQAGNLARQGLSEARRSVRALRSQALETDALSDALQKTLVKMTEGTPLQPQFQLQGTPVALPDDLQLNLLRIGQEAITNALRHAHAQTLSLTLTFAPRQISLHIVDDGRGFDLQSLVDVNGFGLVGIRERSSRFDGQLQLTTNPGQGTTIEVTIPLD